MVETADLSDIGSFLNGLSTDIFNGYKTFNAPSSMPVTGSPVPGRPGFVYGPGGSIAAVNPATGGALPPINSVPVSPTNWTVVAVVVGTFGLVLAFMFSVGRR